MSLLGMPAARRPVVRGVYYMPKDLYDDSDRKDHPVLVVGLDEIRRLALVVTRTSDPGARTNKWAAHAPNLIRDLDRPGWWRLHKVHKVPWVNFDDPDVELLGQLDDETWERVQMAMFREEDQA